MNLIKKIDNYLMQKLTVDLHATDNEKSVKYHSYITVMSIGIVYATLSLHLGRPFLPSMILVIASIIVGFFFLIMATYQWRHFFDLRKKGQNHDRNYFFSESAGFYRKTIFYISLIIFIGLKLTGFGKSDDLKYILESEFYFIVEVIILKSIFVVIVVLELSRVLFASAANWSLKKHILLAIYISIGVSIVQVLLLSFISDHGIF